VVVVRGRRLGDMSHHGRCEMEVVVVVHGCHITKQNDQ